RREAHPDVARLGEEIDRHLVDGAQHLPEDEEDKADGDRPGDPQRAVEIRACNLHGFAPPDMVPDFSDASRSSRDSSAQSAAKRGLPRKASSRGQGASMSMIFEMRPGRAA